MAPGAAGVETTPGENAHHPLARPMPILGYDLRGQRNLNGTRWLRLTIPPAAERDLKQRVKRLCGYTQIPATDLVTSVNALLNGWTQYYRYASNATRRFGYLTGVGFWLTAHYLSRKHRRSIKRLMATHYGVDPRTKKQALYILRPNGKRQFVWNKPPKRLSILQGHVSADDTRPATTTSWASGRSYEQRLEQRAQHGQTCQHCGQTSPRLEVHHPHRLSKQPYRKQGPASLSVGPCATGEMALSDLSSQPPSPRYTSAKAKRRWYWRAGCSDESPVRF